MVKNLKMLRLRSNISQQKLGDIIGVSQQSINKYENHSIEPDIQTLMLLADYFNTSIDYLVGYTDIDHKIEPTEETSLNAEELEYVEKYRKLSGAEKDSIKIIIDNYTERG